MNGYIVKQAVHLLILPQELGGSNGFFLKFCVQGDENHIIVSSIEIFAHRLFAKFSIIKSVASDPLV